MNDQFRKWNILLEIVRYGAGHEIQVGHTFIQKATYLLQKAKGINIGYSFSLYHYGPYAESLWSDLRSLSDIGILDIASDIDGYGYWISIADEKKIADIRTTADDLPSDEIKSVVDVLATRQSKEWELLATTHFVFSDLKNTNRNPQDDSVSGFVTKLKPHFTTEQVKEALNVLRSNNWVT